MWKHKLNQTKRQEVFKKRITKLMGRKNSPPNHTVKKSPLA